MQPPNMQAAALLVVHSGCVAVARASCRGPHVARHPCSLTPQPHDPLGQVSLCWLWFQDVREVEKQVWNVTITLGNAAGHSHALKTRTLITCLPDIWVQGRLTSARRWR